MAIDELMKGIQQWASENAQERSSTDASKVFKTKAQELMGMKGGKAKATQGQIFGFDEATAKNIDSYYKSFIKLESSLNRIMQEHKAARQEAVSILKNELNLKRGISKAEDLRISKQEKLLDILNKEYKIQRRIGAIEKLEPVIGKTSGKMLKYATTGRGGGSFGDLLEKIPFLGKVAKITSRAIAGIAGVLVGVVVGGFNMMLSTAQTVFEQLNVAFTGGMRGVLQATMNIVKGAFDMLEKIPIVGTILGKVGGVISAIGNLLIEQYMFRMEDFVAKSRSAVLAEARTGTMGMEGARQATMAGYQRMFESTGGIRKRTEEWFSALAETGTLGKASEGLESAFYRMGQSMMLSASETGKYFNTMLIMAGSTTGAVRDMSHMFAVAQDAAEKTTMSTTEVSKAISDAALNARMLNVDTQSVANTMTLLADQQKILGKFGIDLKAHGPAMLKALTGIGQGWDMATHSFAGMVFYGKEYQEQEGKRLDAAKAYMMSRYGKKVGMEFKISEEGTWEMGGEKEGADAFKVGTGEMSERLAKIQQYTIAQTSHIKNDAERMMAQKQLLQNVFKIQDENAQTAIMTTKKGQFDKLAADKNMKMAMKTERELAQETLTVQERSEQIQRIIMKATQSILAVLILLPFKLISLLLDTIPGLQLPGVKKAFMDKVSVSGVSFTQLEKGFDTAMSNTMKSVTKLKPLIQEALIEPPKQAVKQSLAESKEEGSVSKKHYGGLIRAHELSRLQFGESISGLAQDELVMMSNRPINIKPKYDVAKEIGMESTTTTTSGSTTYINITVPSSDPDEVATALKTHLARLS